MPLTSVEWLDAHHRAKLAERRRFAAILATYQPDRVVDLGCGTGLWLALLDEILPARCELVGFDVDRDALDVATERSQHWQRATAFEHVDIEADADTIPTSDVTLAFNVFSYLRDPAKLLSTLARRGGVLVVRQYDGAALRFGPMETRLRGSIESSLRASVASSAQFKHYDMDSLYEVLSASSFSKHEFGFELFARTSPFPAEFLAYYQGMLTWTLDLLSEDAADALASWLADATGERYFFEVDLTAVLS
jgi:SAM-dependent methyltransferase